MPKFQSWATSLSRALNLLRPSTTALRVNLYTLFYMIINPFLLLVVGLFFFVTPHVGWLRIFFFIIGSFVIAASLILALISAAALPFVELASARNQHVSVADTIWFGRAYGLRMIGAYLLTSAIILLGLICLVVPGLFLLQRYFLVPYLIADKNMGIRESMATSTELAQHHKSEIWGVVGIQTLFRAIELAPAIGAFVGGVLSLLYLCAPALCYEQVNKLGIKPKRGGKK